MNGGRPQLVGLTHLRWIAAAAVAISHFRNLLMADFAPGGVVKGAFYFLTGFGHAGVVVFFVLSGFLVGGKVREMAAAPVPDLKRYLIDRASRIFVVAWPALALSMAAVALVSAVWPHSEMVVTGGWSAALAQPLAADFEPGRWLGAMGLLNEILTPTPVVNGPLWSLSCEWTYYIAAGAAVVAGRRRWSLVIPYAAVLLGLAAVRDPGLLQGGLVWLLGMLAGAVSDRQLVRGRAALVACSVLAVGALAMWRVHPIPDLALGAAVALAVSHRAWRTWSVAPALGNRLADFSYTLYATHFPLAVIAAALLGSRLGYGAGSIAVTAAAFGVSVAAAWAIALVTERRTRDVRRWIEAALRPRQPVAA